MGSCCAAKFAASKSAGEEAVEMQAAQLKERMRNDTVNTVVVFLNPQACDKGFASLLGPAIADVLHAPATPAAPGG
ncbi:hypothetical protein EON66_11770 [archaeon]|nr:MAG: hypothetical protein EON66_11770 [archaeon]